MDSPFPLHGIRVLDLSRAISGPFAGRMLSDLGADVVKVELPGTDIAQAFGPKSRGHTGLYVQINAGKRNVAIDLAADGGADVLRQLAATVDVVVENFRPGTLDRLGVGWAELSARNPRLVMLSITGFGQSGPESGRQAYAPVVHAESGLLGRQAEVTGDPPADLVMALADSLTAVHGVVAVLAALRLRDTTGEGQWIDLSMLEAMLATDDYAHYSLERTYPIFSAAGLVFDAVGGPLLISADPKYLWHRLSRRFALADPDPDAPTELRIAGRAKLIEEWAASFTDRGALIAALESAGVAWAEVRTPATVADSPTVRARGVVAQVDDRSGGTRPVIRMPYRFSAGSCAPRGGAAFVGEHTGEVLADWLGLDGSDLERLERTGAVMPIPDAAERAQA
jgi:CoA:oxalate CoA-transferase